ncbi:MAG: CDP-alcohol phosphatidyltransferase family protein [Polyangiales bacterium]
MSAPDAGFAEAARRASLGVALAMIAAMAASFVLEGLAPLALVGPLALALLVRKLAPWGGPSTLPNLITALRVILTGALALLAPAWGSVTSALVILLVFVLDGLDGTIARRAGLTSAQGGHFDMEADAFLVLTVCALNVRVGLGAWVLAGGLLRYAYAIAAACWPRGGEAPRTRFGRYAFAASLSALTGALLASPPLAIALGALGTAILLVSFARSFVWLFSR